MKMKPEHLAHLADAILPLDTAARREAYAKAGATPMRYRWDLMYAAGLSQWASDALYPYLDDRHIDTALRSIVALERN